MRNALQLPSLLALRVFECVGRLQSFRAAGEELCISQSAVSYHIKALENDLGVKVFERHARGISFTMEGHTYFDLVRHSFRLLEDGTIAMRASAAPATLKVSVLPSFAAGWLAQRLAKFSKQYPEIDLVLDPVLVLADLNRGDADIAIRFGQGGWADVECELLIAEQLCPVASPGFLAARPAIQTPADVLAHPLLIVQRPFEWTRWADHCGVDLSKAHTVQLAEYNIVLQAAVEGVGIAMGRRSLVSGRIEAGQLVQVFDNWISPTSMGYWICHPKKSGKAAAQAFASWLRKEALAG